MIKTPQPPEHKETLRLLDSWSEEEIDYPWYLDDPVWWENYGA